MAFKKGSIPWNKGKNHSEESIQKMRDAHKGAIFSEEHKEKLRQISLGENNNFFGKHHSEKSNEKNRQAHLNKIPWNKELKGFLAGNKHYNWKGGKVYKHGYVMIYKPEHPFATVDCYVFEHRLIMEEFLGRYLTPEEVVHHDGEKNDNRIEKLRLFKNQKEHAKYHKQQRDLLKLQLDS